MGFIMILAIEDDESIQTLFSQTVSERAGVRLIPARTLQEARQLIEFPGVQYDVIIWDERLPDGSSLPLIKQLKEKDWAGLMVGTSSEVANEQLDAGCRFVCKKKDALGLILDPLLK